MLSLVPAFVGVHASARRLSSLTILTKCFKAHMHTAVEFLCVFVWLGVETQHTTTRADFSTARVKQLPLLRA